MMKVSFLMRLVTICWIQSFEIY